MSKSTRTLLTVAAGVVVGGVILVGLGALIGVVNLGGGSAEFEAGNPDEGIEGSIGEDDTLPAGDRWCNSETGERLAQLGAEVLATEDPARVVELQETIFELSEDAPPGAFCAAEGLDELIGYWDRYTTDSSAQKFEPLEQVERVREFQSENELEGGL